MPPKPAAKPTVTPTKALAQGDRADVKYRTQLDPLLGVSKTLFEVLDIVRSETNPWPEFDTYLTQNGTTLRFLFL
jgi:hypothetical protein